MNHKADCSRGLRDVKVPTVSARTQCGEALIASCLRILGVSCDDGVAQVLLARYGSLSGIFAAIRSGQSLPACAGDLSPLFALSCVLDSAARESAESRAAFSSLDAFRELWGVRLAGTQDEVLEAAYLDSAGRLLPEGIVRLAHGTPQRVTLRPRRVMVEALDRRASGLVLAHNHPNGDPTPSAEDKLLTRALSLAGAPLEVTVVDHVIFAGPSLFSFRANGLL